MSRADQRAARTSELELQHTQDPDHCDDRVMQKYPKKAIKKRTLKPVKDRKIYKAVCAYLALKTHGMKGPEIAEQLGLSPNTLKQYVHIAHSKGWLNINSIADPEDKLEIVLASKAVRNINEMLDERNQEVTLEVAKGIGMLKQHQVVKGEQTSNIAVALRVDVQMPINPRTGVLTPSTVRPGSVGGQPYFDAEILEEQEHAAQ